MAQQILENNHGNWEAIWENPNPNQAFANNQTVSIDLSLYSDICFELKATVDGAAKYYVVIPAIETITILSCIGNIIFERYNVQINTTSINLGVGSALNTYGNRDDNTSNAIPLRIFAR